tara:strand:- start:24335 stop:24910 length:576 start_codon:yes stop_codon:yes gene_type:complete
MEWAYRIDWQALAGFTNAGAIVVVAIIAGSKFDEWKKQFRYRRNAERAERALLAFYEAEQAIGEVRSPMSFAHESDRAREELDAADPDRQSIQAQIFFHRLFDRQEKWDAVVSELAPIRFGFGPDTSDALREILKVTRSIQVAAQMYPGTEDGEFRQKLERDFWKTNDQDELSVRLVQAREKLEKAFEEFT